jgi:hypothetical protein
MTETSACTPEGGLEALADALFRHHRLDIPCEGEGEHTPLTKDKAGRRDGQGRLYRYWTCTRCQPRTKRNCRSYIEAARKVLGQEIVRDLAIEVLERRRTTLEPYDLLEAWVRGKSLVHVVAASSKRKSSLPHQDIPNKRARVVSHPDSPLDLPPSEAEALRAAYAAREAIDRCIAVLTGTGGDTIESPSEPPTDNSSRSTLPDNPLRRPLSSSPSSPVLSRGHASYPVDLPATALYSSTALATPRSLRPPGAPATFQLPARSSVNITPRRAAAPSPDRFSDLSSLPSSPIAFRRPIERTYSPRLSTTSPRLSTTSPRLSTTSPRLSTAVSRPDPSSSLRPIANAGGRSRARREAKKQKKPEPKYDSGGSEENVPPAEEEVWTAADRLC